MPAVTLQPRYELTLFKPKSEDPTESQVLTQLEDANEQFVVTTDPTDSRPYLAIPTGRGGQIQVPQRKVEIGTSSVRVLDARVTGQLDRWVTRFIGDAQGRNRLKGLKARLREWESSSSSWMTLYTRRVQDVRMSDTKLWLDLGLKDLVDDLDMEVFTGPPHGSLGYVARGSLLPAGLVDAWAGLLTVAPLTGTVAGSGSRIVVDRTAVDDGRDVLIKELDDRLWDPAIAERQSILLYTPEYITTARVRVKITESTVDPGRVGEEGDFWLAKTITTPGTWIATQASAVAFELDDRQRRRVTQVGIMEVRPEDPKYLTLPAATDVVEFHVFGYGAATENDPILIGPVHPAQLVEDLLAGKFGPLVEDPADGTVGDPLISFGADASAFAALEADPSFGELYLVIRKSRNLRELIEETVNLPHGLGYRIDEQARYVPIDWRLTQADIAGLVTLGDDDVVAGQTDALEWDDREDGAVTKIVTKYYTDVLQVPWRLNQVPDGVPDVPAVRFATSEHERIDILARFGQLGEDGLDINAEGVRDIVSGVRADSSDRVKAQVARIPDAFRSAFGSGPRFITLKCRRTANVMSCVEGSLRKLAYSPILDPATNRRGGARLARCIQRTPQAVHVILRFLDLGSDTVAASPAVGAVLKNATDGRHAVDVPATLNAQGEPAIVEYSVTETSTSIRPDEDDASWRRGGKLTQTGTLVVRPVPSGKRIWLRARTEVDEARDPKIPSGWVFPAASYVDTDTLPAPSNVQLTAVGRTLVATCTVGDADLPIMPVIAPSPGPAVDAVLAALPPGSARFTFTGLAAATTYVAGFKHVDGLGGESATVTASLATGQAVQLAAPRRVQIRQGRTSASAELAVPSQASIGYGLWVSWHPSEPLARHHIQVSTDSGFATVETELVVDAGVTLYPVIVQRDAADAMRYVRIRAERAEHTPSSWSDVVGANATELLTTPGPGDLFPGGYSELRALPPGGELELRIGDGGDGDTERAYYVIVKNPQDPTVYPTVDESADFLDRSALPYDGPVDDGQGGNLAGVAGDVFRGRVRFWNPITGFGQEVLLKLDVPAVLPTIIAYPYTPADTTKEGVRLVARGDGQQVRVFSKVYAENANPVPPLDDSGLQSDPWEVQLEVPRPGPGDQRQVVAFYSEDAAGNKSHESPQLLYVDGNIIPTGWFEHGVNEKGEPEITPAKDDLDTGSWRYRVNRTTLSDTTTFLSPAYSDVAADEYSGAAFGVVQQLTDWALTNQRLNVEGWFFRTTDPSASAQQASTPKYGPVRYSIPVATAGKVGNYVRIIRAWWFEITAETLGVKIEVEVGPSTYDVALFHTDPADGATLIPAIPGQVEVIAGVGATRTAIVTVKVATGGANETWGIDDFAPDIQVHPREQGGALGDLQPVHFEKVGQEPIGSARQKDQSGATVLRSEIAAKAGGGLNIDPVTKDWKVVPPDFVSWGTAAPGALPAGHIYGRHA